MSGLCAILASGLAVLTAAESFQLTWSHSVEKLEWREDWRVAEGRLSLEQASVEGSGAGMEPPPQARREGSRWVWRPGIIRDEIVLAQSDFTGDWRLCVEGDCKPLRKIIQGETARLTACPP